MRIENIGPFTPPPNKVLGLVLIRNERRMIFKMIKNKIKIYSAGKNVDLESKMLELAEILEVKYVPFKEKECPS